MDSIMKTSIVTFTSYDGYELEGSMVKAVEEKGALLFVHGITSSRDELGFHSGYAQFLGENGITSLRFDYRFHGKNESTLEQLSLCGIVNDIDAAFCALRKKADKDTSSFFVVGTSFGGGLVAFWIDKGGGKGIKKIILNAPVIDYEDDVLARNGLLKNGRLIGDAAAELRYKSFVNSSDIHFGRGLINELKYVNGIEAIRKLGHKVVIFHGNQDDDVPLASTMKYKATSTKVQVIDGVGHGFGVKDDEELNFPETKAIHRSIYEDALRIIEASL